ncbi:MAG: uncharacterized protein KVP18_001496 [Porospora cf. gigantea A]|uniref:uncharacterized protein n=1 Tax=Porospora cf. gigantea A TaxID=2853593 RepID=UPI00355A9424|nr:MAG: hypothetical protein KVP18_001496 [Porospora cf. gigantea A]
MPCCAGSGVPNDKFSTLPDACYHGNLDKIKEIMKKDKDADLTKSDHDGNTCLHRAAQSGSAEVITFLLENGADPTKKTKAGETALQVAVFHRNLTAVEALLKSKSVAKVINYKDDKLQMTPLHVAIRNGSADIVKVLLDSGADVKEQDATAQDALALALFWHQQAQSGMASPKAEHGKALEFIQKAVDKL